MQGQYHRLVADDLATEGATMISNHVVSWVLINLARCPRKLHI